MDDPLKTILAAFGGLSATVVALVSVAYGFFRWFGEKFIEARFASSLEAVKHERQKELEKVKFEINQLFDRSTKFHQREFDILPTAWAMLEDARAHVGGTIRPFQQFPDLSRMPDSGIRNLLSSNNFKDYEIEEIVSHTSPNEALSNKLTWRSFADSQKSAQAYIFYIRKNGIFIPKEIQNQFIAAGELVWNALIEWEMQRRWTGGNEKFPAQEAFGKNLPPLMDKLETELRNRLSSLSKEAAAEEHTN
jgi:hypothetical protein